MIDADRFPPPGTREELLDAFTILADTRAPVNVAALAHRIRVATLADRQRQAALTAALARALNSPSL